MKIRKLAFFQILIYQAIKIDLLTGSVPVFVNTIIHNFKKSN